MLITSDYTFEGYRILQYLGFVSGQVALGTGPLSEIAASFTNLFGIESGMFSDKLEQVQASAFQEIEKRAKLYE